MTGFLEKPQTDEEIDMIRTEPSWIDARGIPAQGRDCLASMGLYIFNRELLFDVLNKTNYEDFGKEVFPAAIRSRKVQVHLFDDYWEDIGTIKAFYEANLALTKTTLRSIWRKQRIQSTRELGSCLQPSWMVPRSASR